MWRRPAVTILAIDPDDDTRWLEVCGTVVGETAEGADAHIDALACGDHGVDEAGFRRVNRATLRYHGRIRRRWPCRRRKMKHPCARTGRHGHAKDQTSRRAAVDGHRPRLARLVPSRVARDSRRVRDGACRSAAGRWRTAGGALTMSPHMRPELTASSVRSCVAPASSSSSGPASGLKSRVVWNQSLHFTQTG
jgi:hypothetical protein